MILWWIGFWLLIGWIEGLSWSVTLALAFGPLILWLLLLIFLTWCLI